MLCKAAPIFKDDSRLIRIFANLVRSVASTDINALGVMHTKINIFETAIDILSDQWKGAKIAYAEIGHFCDDGWDFSHSEEPNNYLNTIKKLASKYQIEVIGGCCGTTPEHIKSLALHYNNQFIHQNV